MSFDRLIERIAKLQNPTVVGLDSCLDYVPEEIKNSVREQYKGGFEFAAECIWRFNKGIIDAIYDIVPAIKPQAAYYEMYGWRGMKVLADTVEYAKSKGIFVIIDGKRNDIGSTMQAYATAHLGKTKIDDELHQAFGGDALTVNGYLGSDGIKPLIDACIKYDKGIFILVKTSNPSSGELQDKMIDDLPVYSHMGLMCEEYGKGNIGEYGYSAVGAVVGATYARQLNELRKMLPGTFFLIPGYGAQGGGGKEVAGAFDKNGLGGIVNSSRGIICAYQKQNRSGNDFAIAAREEAIRMKQDILKYIGEIKL